MRDVREQLSKRWQTWRFKELFLLGLLQAQLILFRLKKIFFFENWPIYSLSKFRVAMCINKIMIFILPLFSLIVHSDKSMNCSMADTLLLVHTLPLSLRTDPSSFNL